MCICCIYLHTVYNIDLQYLSDPVGVVNPLDDVLYVRRKERFMEGAVNGVHSC